MQTCRLQIVDCRRLDSNRRSTSCTPSFNYPDSATDPIQIVRRYTRADDREVVGFVRGGAGLRPRGERAAVDRARAGGDRRRPGAPTSARSIRAATRRRSRTSSTAGRASADLVALLWLLRQMIDRAGSIEGFFRRRATTPAPHDVGAALDSFSTRALALDLTAGLRPACPTRAGRLLLLSAAVGRQRVQAAEPVPALDGAPRRARSRRVDARLAGAS